MTHGRLAAAAEVQLYVKTARRALGPIVVQVHSQSAALTLSLALVRVALMASDTCSRFGASSGMMLS